MRGNEAMPIQRWEPGDTVLYRLMVMGRSAVTIAMTVAADQPGLLMLYRPTGAPCRFLRADDGDRAPRGISTDDFRALSGRTVDTTWEMGPALLLVPTGAEHGIFPCWTADRTFDRWYVNLQQPVNRVPDGFETTDEFLDIVVRPNLDWVWKDEDDLARAVETGRMTTERAEAVRSEGKRVILDIIERRSPFDGTVRDWRPDPLWAMPTLANDRPGRWLAPTVPGKP